MASPSVLETYESLLDHRLQGELEKVLDARDALYKTTAQWAELSKLLRKAQHNNILSAMINLGGEFFAQAKVPDPTFVYVSIGLGFHVQLTLDECVEFCIQRKAHCTAAAVALREIAAGLKMRIKLMLAAIDGKQQQAT